MRNYLAAYKRASAFSRVYEMMPDFWKTQHQWIDDYAAGEKSAKERYLITETISSQGCGYIELNYENPQMPDVEIAKSRERIRDIVLMSSFDNNRGFIDSICSEIADVKQDEKEFRMILSIELDYLQEVGIGLMA